MKYLAIFAIFLCIAGLTMAADYTDQQKAIMQGLRLSYQLGEAHQKYMTGGDVSTFNALIDQWNSWVQTNFGQDPNLLMQKVTGPADLSKPYLLANNTTQGGIVHSIDGSNNRSSKYTTNDVNLLPQGVADQWRRDNPGMGDGYLSGV
ncbi:MAG: hypothetical protein PHQ34_09155 [Methanothrix sp.]|nr:hypothetical protein [Methanothrix sp.]